MCAPSESFNSSHSYAGASSLPLRLLATEYGADLVWSEEIIASKIAVCSRVCNTHTGAIEFVGKAGGHAVFQTMPDRERVVFQLGCSSAADAVRAAELVSADVVAIDVNMGCNKHAAVSCGMGAALGSDPVAAADVIKVRGMAATSSITDANSHPQQILMRLNG